jgi:hypothetical protein
MAAHGGIFKGINQMRTAEVAETAEYIENSEKGLEE